MLGQTAVPYVFLACMPFPDRPNAHRPPPLPFRCTPWPMAPIPLYPDHHHPLPSFPLQVHSLANGPEVVKPLLETSRKASGK